MRRALHISTIRDVLLATASAVAIICLASIVVPRGPVAAPPRINGAYDLHGSGPGVVTGMAVVSAQQVRITGTLTDVAGNQVPFTATNLAMDRSTYRFKGAATLGSSTAAVIVSGRVDPDDKTLKKCRIVGTFVAYDGRAGRFAGTHR